MAFVKIPCPRDKENLPPPRVRSDWCGKKSRAGTVAASCNVHCCSVPDLVGRRPVGTVFMDRAASLGNSQIIDDEADWAKSMNCIACLVELIRSRWYRTGPSRGSAGSPMVARSSGCATRHLRNYRAILHMIRAGRLAICCGYEDADDVDFLRFDPAFKLACGTLPDVGAVCVCNQRCRASRRRSGCAK
jgi:hypothetical protein